MTRKKLIIVMKKILSREVLLYLIFGVLTTVVNLLVFKLCLPYMNYLIANVIAWFISVLFAFITNRNLVFQSSAIHWKEKIKELFSFFSSRIFTLILESVILFIFIQCLKFPDNWVKLSAQIIVIVANYILSKLVVFKD